jgi:hypothetical protein
MYRLVIACSFFFAATAAACAADYYSPLFSDTDAVFIDPTTITDAGGGHRRFMQNEVDAISVSQKEFEFDCPGKRWQLRTTKVYSTDGTFMADGRQDLAWSKLKPDTFISLSFDFVCGWPASAKGQEKISTPDFWDLAQRAASHLKLD